MISAPFKVANFENVGDWRMYGKVSISHPTILVCFRAIIRTHWGAKSYNLATRKSYDGFLWRIRNSMSWNREASIQACLLSAVHIELHIQITFQAPAPSKTSRSCVSHGVFPLVSGVKRELRVLAAPGLSRQQSASGNHPLIG